MTILGVLIAQEGMTNIAWIEDITCASFLNSNHYGYYLLIAVTISAFLFITEKDKTLKIISLLMYLFLLYYLIINDTFGCYLAFIAVLTAFLIFSIIKKWDKKFIAIVIICFILISIFANLQNKNLVSKNIFSLFTDLTKILSGNSTKKEIERAGTGRMRLWINGINFFFQRPIFGYGPENLESKYLEVGINQDRPHNLLIQLATTSGFPGLILYCTAIGIILYRSIRTLKEANQIQITLTFTVIAYLISAMFGNSMYYTSPYYFILLGFLFTETNKIEKET